MGNIKMDWKTSGGKAIKGSLTMPFTAIAEATQMKIKPVNGNERLDQYITRWLIPYCFYADLAIMGNEVKTSLDKKEVKLASSAEETKKTVKYNSKKVELSYAEASNKMEGNLLLQLGMIKFMNDIIFLHSYKDKDLSIELTSITTPVLKKQSQQDLANEIADEILKSLTPKAPVPLTKMKASKFAKVKAQYPILARIESFDATKGGKVKKPTTETYEFRVGTGSPNPPSLVDCLTSDLQVLYNQKDKFSLAGLSEEVTSKSLPATAAAQLLNIYVTYSYSDIPGYRPWSNSQFLKSLTSAERSQLAKELEGYVNVYGILSE
jgi:hypothetical protein